MTPGDRILLTLLLFLALPIGLKLTAGLVPAKSRVARGGTATLAGLGLLTAVSHTLACAGVRARISVPILAALSIAGGTWFLVRSWRRERATSPFGAAPVRHAGRRFLAIAGLELLPLVIVCAMLAHPFGHARSFAIDEHDTIHIWAPKAARILDEAPPDLANEMTHAHSEYPRGLGILTAAPGAPFDHLDPRLPRTVPLLLFALTLLCVFDALSARGNTAGAFAAMVILGSIPLVLRHAISGLADLPLAAFIVLGGVGLAGQKDGRPSIAVTLAGGLGAMAVKDEGLVFCCALLLVLVVGLFRAGRPAQALAAMAVVALLAAPWIALRSKPDSGVPFLWRSAIENSGLVILRFDQIVREVAHLVLGFPDPSPDGLTLPDILPGGDMVHHVALLCGLVLLVGGSGRFPVLPVGLLLLADLVAILMSHVVVDWQLVTALNRLVLQCLPFLVLAAVDKLTMQGPAGAAGSARTRAPA